jgi:hypothetical protein
MTIVLYLGVRRKFRTGKGGFDLGRLEWPVAIAALMWVLNSLFMVISSSTTLASMVIVVGLLIPGVAYFLYMLKFNPGVLEHEPGVPDAFVEPVK